MFALASACLGREIKLENKSISWIGNLDAGQLRPAELHDKINAKALKLDGDCFDLELGDGSALKSSDFKLVGDPKIIEPKTEPDSHVVAKHSAGRQLVAEFSAPDKGLAAEWRVVLRDGSSYVRQILTLRVTDKDVLVREIVLFAQKIPGSSTDGSVDGSPVVAGDFFFGYEHPMARNTVDAGGVVRCSYQRNAVLKARETLSQSCVLGVAPSGQMRRGFLAYIERERAHPYRPFLHYNSWYDIAWHDRKYNQAECVNAIKTFGEQLVTKRGVKMDSFLFDDGWDDNRTLWKFNKGFPDGFAPLKKEAEKFHAGIGVWLSPFGGYGKTKQQRLAFGRAEGYETNATGFSLAGPKYFKRFHDICMEFVQKYGVNQFKFDGLATGGKAAANGLTRDGDAMLRLIADLRAAEPDIYINQTTGTWPSPFWLLYVDSTWRSGDDHSFTGQGSWCQKWITYRDEQTFRNVVQRAPLYPLNSLMLHGIIYAKNAQHLKKMSDSDFADQVRSFFGTGTQLQEMYITPALLNEQNWDDLAEAANWSRANARTLIDTHWIGGDPGKGEVYGWASWSPHHGAQPSRGIIVLRNPTDQPVTFRADVAKLFELPPGANTNYTMHSPWKSDRDQQSVELSAGHPHAFTLRPFQVLVLESN